MSCAPPQSPLATVILGFLGHISYLNEEMTLSKQPVLSKSPYNI